jgi:hypothetical protein
MTKVYHPNIEELFDQMSGVEWWIIDLLMVYPSGLTCMDLVYYIYTDEKTKKKQLFKRLDAEIGEGVEDLQKHSIPVLIGTEDVVSFDPNSDKTQVFILEWRNYWKEWNRQASEKMQSTSRSTGPCDEDF